MPGEPLGAQELFGCQLATSSWERASIRGELAHTERDTFWGLVVDDPRLEWHIWSTGHGAEFGGESKYMITQQSVPRGVYLLRTSGSEI